MRNLINWFKRKKIVTNEFDLVGKTNELTFFRQYEYYGGYGTEVKIKKESLSDIIFKYKDSVKTSGGVLIESKFNNIYYPVFDIDNLDDFALFKNLYSPTPYVLFSSSKGHYWGILDTPYDNINKIFLDHNWKICNDQKYIEYSRNYKLMSIRGLYENESRKPSLYTINGNLSENFQLFIDKIVKYYNKEGLELSVLRYKDPLMLIKFNRKRKLEQINKVNE